VFRARERRIHRGDLCLSIIDRRFCRLVRRIALSNNLPYLRVGSGNARFQRGQSQTCVTIVNLGENLSPFDRIAFNDGA
jgi:hypothetical protein